jgi:hypothetical protein
MRQELLGRQDGRDFLFNCREPASPNGLRYPLVGGRRQRHFAGTNLKPRKVPENAPTPTRRVHAVLGAFFQGFDPGN